MWKQTFLILCYLRCIRADKFHSYFKRYVTFEWHNRFLLRRVPTGPSAEQTKCLQYFDADMRLLNASGQSIWRDGWKQQLGACTKLGARYVVYASALWPSRAWRQEVFAMGRNGQMLSEAWTSEAEKELVERLRSQPVSRERSLQVLTQLGVCVPAKCHRSSEKQLGWHVVLKIFGLRGYGQVPPRRSQILLRLHEAQQASVVEELKESLLSGPKPAWYLQQFQWNARPSRLGFVAPTITQEFFRHLWSMWVTRLQVSSRQRTMMCTIPKVGLTEFFMLMQRIGMRNASYSDFNNTHLRHDDRVVAWFATHDYWRDSRWKYILFVRDPLERFLSAFTDKCLQTSTHCGDDDRIGWNHVTLQSTLHEKIQAFQLYVALPIPTLKMLEDDHWILQSVYTLYGCGLTWHRIDFIGLMSADRAAMNFQVRAMLHGALGFSWKFSSDLAAKYFPSEGFSSAFAAKHAKNHRGDATKTFKAFYSNQDVFLNITCLEIEDLLSLNSFPQKIEPTLFKAISS